jgi:hypothetical protein
MKFFATLPFVVAVLSAVSVSAAPAPMPAEAAAPAAGGKGGGAGDIITAVVELGIDIAKSLMEGIQGDKDARSEFTQKLVSETRSKYPDRNVVVCHTKHHYKWDGVQGQDWEHRHQEFDVQIGGTVGYEIYIAKGGEFWREGDGGYLNVRRLLPLLNKKIANGLIFSGPMQEQSSPATTMASILSSLAKVQVVHTISR